MLRILALIFVFVIVFGAAALLLLRTGRDPLKQRIARIGKAAEEDAPRKNWLDLLGKLSPRFAQMSEPTDTSELRVRFLNAGLRDPNAPKLHLTAKTLLALVGLAIGIALRAGHFASGQLLVSTAIVLLFAAAGLYLPDTILNNRIKKRKREIAETLPDALDLMTVCVEAGLAFDSAMVRVTREMDTQRGALKEELELTLLEIGSGGQRERALRNLALRVGVADVDALVTILIQADRFGIGIGESLRTFSNMMRAQRQQRAEEQAAKVPIKMLFPTVICIFPALFVVILAPAGFDIVRTLLPTMSGGN
jgi:tight adherence protein C